MFNVYAVAVWVLLSSREKKAVCGQQRANDTRGFNDVIGVNTLGWNTHMHTKRIVLK